jgi:hypothetical protein
MKAQPLTVAPVVLVLVAVASASPTTAADLATVAAGLVELTAGDCSAPGYAVVAAAYDLDLLWFHVNSGRYGVVGCGGVYAFFEPSTECTGGPGSDLVCARPGGLCPSFTLTVSGDFDATPCGLPGSGDWLATGQLVRADAAP